MKALVLRAIKEPLSYEDLRGPEPGEGEVVVKLEAAALNRRDYWIQQGLYPRIRCPVVLGSDGAGVVARAGRSVDTVWLGKDVIMYPGYNWGDDDRAQRPDFKVLGMPHDGTLAEEIVVPARQLFPRPGHLSWQEAAALPLAGLTAYRAVFTQGKLQAGQTVLITGIGGGVAHFALIFAVSAGARVLVTSSSPEKLERARALGAAAGFEYTAPDWATQLRASCGLVDLVIDGAGGPAYPGSIDVTAPGGRIVIYGATAGLPDRFDVFKLFWRQLHVVGSSLGTPEEFAAMLDHIDRRRIRPAIARVLPLSAGNEALECMRELSQFGKLVLTPAR